MRDMLFAYLPLNGKVNNFVRTVILVVGGDDSAGAAGDDEDEMLATMSM